MMREMHAFTLIELLVTISIAAILLAVAAPSYQSVIQSNRSVNTANELVSLLTLARSEAVKRNTQVLVCMADTSDTSKCASSGSEWSTGALVVVDANGNGQVDDADQDIVRAVVPLANNKSVSVSWNRGRQIAYGSDGRSGNGTFSVTQAGDKTNKYAKYVKVSSTGRPAVRDSN